MSMPMPNSRFDRGTGISSGSPIRKWFAVSLMGKCQSSSTQAPRTPQSTRRKYTSAEWWRAPCICIMHILPRDQPEIPPCGIALLFSVSQILTVHSPTIPLSHVSYQLSYAHQSILSSFPIGHSPIRAIHLSPAAPPPSPASGRLGTHTALHRPTFTYIPPPISSSYSPLTTPLLS